jgi:UDP-GlcNAc:undecaprenyl-phosphate GlcNAc-1-phosphate transferase
MIAQLAAVLIMVFGAGLIMRDIGDPLWIGTIRLGFLALPITALIFITVINAFNLVDGVDGLAGTLAIIALLGIAGVAVSVRRFRHLAIASLYLRFLVSIFQLATNAVPAFMGGSCAFIGLRRLVPSHHQGPSRQISRSGLWFAAVPLRFFTCLPRIARQIAVQIRRRSLSDVLYGDGRARVVGALACCSCCMLVSQ